jgi:hypothetical protein
MKGIVMAIVWLLLVFTVWLANVSEDMAKSAEQIELDRRVQRVASARKCPDSDRRRPDSKPSDDNPYFCIETTDLVTEAAEQNKDGVIAEVEDLLKGDMGSYNDVYLGLHNWFPDGWVIALFTNIEQLLEKWFFESVDSWGLLGCIPCWILTAQLIFHRLIIRHLNLTFDFFIGLYLRTFPTLAENRVVNRGAKNQYMHR